MQRNGSKRRRDRRRKGRISTGKIKEDMNVKRRDE
jgi:hypothetical protein